VIGSTVNPEGDWPTETEVRALQPQQDDVMNVVLKGMAQLQDVVTELSASPKQGERPEAIKPGVTNLPELPLPGPESCLLFSDWIHNSRPPLSDVSDTSEELWEGILSEAGVWYSNYLKLDPLSRLVVSQSGNLDFDIFKIHQVAQGHPDISFRVNLVRHNLQDQERPQSVPSPPPQAKVKGVEAQVATAQVSPPPPPAQQDSQQQIKSMLADAAMILQQAMPPRTQGSGDQVGQAANNQVASTANVAPGEVTPGTPVTLASLSAQLDSLRSMTRDYEARMMRFDEVHCSVSAVALLDSGATHPVVPFAKGMSGLQRVPVTLAGDSKEEWYRTRGGTLVVPPAGPTSSIKPQTIIPLGALVENLGCSVSWSKRGGLKEDQALSLISQLEDKRLNEFKDQVEELEVQMESMRLRLAESLVGLDDESGKNMLKQLPVNRAHRSENPLKAWCEARDMQLLEVDLLAKGGALEGRYVGPSCEELEKVIASVQPEPEATPAASPKRQFTQREVEGAGIGIQHRRVAYPQSFALSIDLFGPVPKHEHGAHFSTQGQLPEKQEEFESGIGPEFVEDFGEYEPSDPGEPLNDELRGLPALDKEEPFVDVLEGLQKMVLDINKRLHHCRYTGGHWRLDGRHRLAIDPLKDADRQILGRWVKYRYAAPRSSIPEGHVLITAVDDVIEEEIPEESGGVPQRRLREKTAVRFIEVAIEASAESYAKECIVGCEYTHAAFHRLMDLLLTEEGVTKLTYRRPHTAQKQSEWVLVGYTPLGFRIPEVLHGSPRVAMLEFDDEHENSEDTQCVNGDGGVHCELGRLSFLGVDDPEDLQYLYEEDLIEMGMPRPDNPNVSGLQTGEEECVDHGFWEDEWVYSVEELGAEGQVTGALPSTGAEGQVTGALPSTGAEGSSVKRVDESFYTPEVERILKVEALEQMCAITRLVGRAAEEEAKVPGQEILTSTPAGYLQTFCVHVETIGTDESGFALCQRAYIEELARSYELTAKGYPQSSTHYRGGASLVFKIGIRLIEFLISTVDQMLSLTPASDVLPGINAYSDASFAPFGGKSVSGILLQFRGKNVLWKGQRQTIVCLSTAEAELVAATEATVLSQSLAALIGEFDICLGVGKYCLRLCFGEQHRVRTEALPPPPPPLDYQPENRVTTVREVTPAPPTSVVDDHIIRPGI
ncbi:GIP, partial [Symbiodinium necroappetens]